MDVVLNIIESCGILWLGSQLPESGQHSFSKNRTQTCAELSVFLAKYYSPQFPLNRSLLDLKIESHSVFTFYSTADVGFDEG